MTNFTHRIDKLSQKKCTLLAHRLRQQAGRSDGRGDAPEASVPPYRTERLVAYVVAEPAQSPTGSEIRQFLDEKLPPYMVPATFVFLEALPLNANGKVDRRALPEPTVVIPEMDDTFVAPRTPVEETLAEIWADVLGFDQVGVHDHFFEMGGDSILSIRIISRANRAGIRVTPEQFFEHPTIAAMAMVAGAEATVRAEQGLVTGTVPLTPIQHWFFEHHHIAPHHWNQAALLESPGNLDVAMIAQALQCLLRHHDALRLCFVRQEAHWQQRHGDTERTVDLTEVDMATLSTVEQRATIETTANALHASLDLDCGPLVKAALLKLGAGSPSRLLLVIHHLVIDAISWRILLEDLGTAYRQLSRGEAVELPPKTTSFKDWSDKLAAYTQTDSLRAERDYWLAVQQRSFVGLPVDALPAEAVNTVASSRTVSMALSAAETQVLLHEVPQAYHTQMNDALLTALGCALASWMHTRTLLIGLEGHGREDLFDTVDVSRTVGWFTSFFPVVLDLEEAAEPAAQLMAVKEQLRQIPTRGMGYGMLRYLSQDQDFADQLCRLPEPEVSFKLLGAVRAGGP